MTGPAEPAFDEFYRAEWPGLLRAVGFALGDRDLARRCVDEAMARAYARWDRVAAVDRPAGWVYRAAIEEAGGWGRAPQAALGPGGRPPTAVARPAAAPGAAPGALGAAATDLALARALAALPLDLRALLVLRYHLDWPVDDVARALGLPRATARSRLHRGLRRLERALAEPA